MIITSLRTLRLAEFPHLIWLEIRTDDGLAGLGETFFAPAAVESYLHENVAPYLLGQDPGDIERHDWTLRNVYVGAKQNLSGGTQVQVQVDITRRLKAQATLSTTTNATVTKGNAAQDNGSSVGLSYQFEY